LIFVGSERKRYQTSKQKNPHSKSFQHWESPEFFSASFLGQTNILAPTSGINPTGSLFWLIDVHQSRTP
jgi:hypothetical protein